MLYQKIAHKYLMKTAGMFTFSCKRCTYSLGAGDEVWTKYAVAISKANKVCEGKYNGYGKLENPSGSVVCEVQWDDPKYGDVGDTVYHYACWVKAGKPKRHQGPSDSHQDWDGTAPKNPLSTLEEAIPKGFSSGGVISVLGLDPKNIGSTGKKNHIPKDTKGLYFGKIITEINKGLKEEWDSLGTNIEVKVLYSLHVGAKKPYQFRVDGYSLDPSFNGKRLFSFYYELNPYTSIFGFRATEVSSAISFTMENTPAKPYLALHLKMYGDKLKKRYGV